MRRGAGKRRGGSDSCKMEGMWCGWWVVDGRRSVAGAALKSGSRGTRREESGSTLIFAAERRHGLGFGWGPLCRLKFAGRKQRAPSRKSALCGSFWPKRRHKSEFVGKRLHGIELLSKTAGNLRANRFCVEVFAENVDTDRVSLKKPQVGFREIDSLSKFRSKTSTESGFCRQTSTWMGLRLKTSTKSGDRRQNRRPITRKSILCRGFLAKRRH